MPGTIHISVLDFMGLPSTSDPSSISMKVSMGKREYQTWAKGDFSFPLVTLRDNLIITLQDEKGNEISNTGIETISVVERGCWDDLFPLEGGGHLHLKLEFILSNEDRNRIRIMRESALKKKHGEILNSNSLCSETAGAAATIGGAPSSLHQNNFVPGNLLNFLDAASSQDPQKSIIQVEAVRSGELVPIQDETTKETPINQRHTNPVKKYIRRESSEEIPLAAQESKGIEDLHQIEVNNRNLVQERETQLVPMGISSKPEEVNAAERTVVSSNLDVDRSEQDPPDKTPSDVRKMISAFEHSLAQPKAVNAAKRTIVSSNLAEDQAKQNPPDKTLGDPKGVKAAKRKIVSYELEKDPFKDNPPDNTPSNPKGVNAAKRTVVSSKLDNDSFKGDPSGKTPSNVRKMIRAKFDKDSFKDNPPDKTPSNVRKMISAFECSLAQDMKPGVILPKSQPSKTLVEVASDSAPLKEVKAEHLKPLGVDSARISRPLLIGELEKNLTFVGKTKEQMETQKAMYEVKTTPTCIQLEDHINSNERIKSEEACKNKDINEEGESSEDLLRSSINQTDSCVNSVLVDKGSGTHLRDPHENDEVESVANVENACSSESSGGWIFPYDAKGLCITSWGRKVMDLVGICDVEAQNPQGITSSARPEAISEHNVHAESNVEAKEKLHNPKRSELDKSADDETLGNPVGQAIKIAIMVGFGILVLLTRNRKTR